MKNLKDLVNGVKGITFHGFIENEIDISELENGIYFLKIVYNNKTELKRVVKN